MGYYGKVLKTFLRLKVQEVWDVCYEVGGLIARYLGALVLFVGGAALTLGVVYGLGYVRNYLTDRPQSVKDTMDTGFELFVVMIVGTAVGVLFVFFCGWIRNNWREAKQIVGSK